MFFTSNSSLTNEQYSLLSRLVHWAQYTRHQSILKSRYFHYQEVAGPLPSILIADSLLQTEWGTHPVSLDVFRNKDANNMNLLTVDDVWEGEKTRYQGKAYKMFMNWNHYFTHLSDLISFTSQFGNLSTFTTIEDQLKVWSTLRSKNLSYNEDILQIIKKYELRRYDFHDNYLS